MRILLGCALTLEDFCVRTGRIAGAMKVTAVGEDTEGETMLFEDWP